MILQDVFQTLRKKISRNLVKCGKAERTKTSEKEKIFVNSMDFTRLWMSFKDLENETALNKVEDRLKPQS